MKTSRRLFFALAVLTLTALACQLFSGLGSNVILSDDFSSDSWGTGTDADSSVEYANDALQFLVFRPNYFVWSPSPQEDYSNLHIEVTALNNSTDTTTAFGVICHMQITNVSYYFAVTPAGQYAIGKSQLAGDDVFLTNNDEWANSDSIPVNQSSYRVGADCGGDGTLTLYVNGTQIATVNDTTYTSGNVALFVWSGDQQSGANVSFDDFQMTRLP
jgi:hypothetical protein